MTGTLGIVFGCRSYHSSLLAMLVMVDGLSEPSRSWRAAVAHLGGRLMEMATILVNKTALSIPEKWKL